MIRPGWKSLLLVGVVALALVSATSDAQACRWLCGGCGYGPACGGCGGYWGGACGYGCGCGIYGGYCGVPVRACAAPCGWYRGCCGYSTCGSCGWGTCGSYGCGTCGYGCGWGACDSCGWGTPVVSGCCGATTYTGAVTVPATPSPTPTLAPVAPKAETPAVVPAEAKPITPAVTPVTPAPVPPALPATPSAKPTAAPLPIPGALPAIPANNATLNAPTMESSAILTVYVPAEAKVTINGKLTKTTGSKRQYVSFGLMSGFSYKYEVKAQIVRDGQLLEDTKVISLTAGERGAVAFGFNLRTAEGLAASY